MPEYIQLQVMTVIYSRLIVSFSYWHSGAFQGVLLPKAPFFFPFCRKGDELCPRYFANAAAEGYIMNKAKLHTGETAFMKRTSTETNGADFPATDRDNRRAQEFTEAVMNNMSEGLYTVDSQGRLMMMNLAAERLFRLKLDDVRGQCFHDVVHYLHPDGTPFPAEECETLRKLTAGKAIANQQEVFVRGDGTMFTAVYSSSPINIEDEIRGTVVVFRDVSEERRIDDERRQAEDILRRKAALIELSHDPIFVWDPDTGIVEWNKGAEILYGYSRDEAIGQKTHELLKTTHPGGFAKFETELVDSGFWSGEIKHFAKDGTELIVESRQQIIDSMGRQLVLESNRDITERKRSEGILERYRMLSENSRDVIWLLSEEFRFVEVNQAAVDLYGYSREEFLEMNLRDIREPSTLTDFDAQFELAGTKGIHFETLHVRKDGTVFPVDVNANGADLDGQRLVLAIVRDISDRKRSDDALRASEERRKLAQEAGQVGVWDWDATLGKTYWSETMWTIYDAKPAQDNPDDEFWSSLLHPSDRERVRLNVSQTLRSAKKRFQDEFRIIKKDGTVRWIEAIASIERGPDGNALRMYGVNLDISGRKETEERIRLSENQLRLVTNAVPALISYVDNNQHYRFVNQQFTEWFGFPTEEMVGKSVRDVFGDEAYSVVKPRIEEALAGEQVKFETSLNYRAVGPRYVHVSYMPDIGVDGTIYGYYGLTNDLTDLKRSQDLLRATEERMALMVENVTDYAIFSMDSAGKIDSWNTGAELIFGYSQDEIMGQPNAVLFTAEDVIKESHQKEMTTARQKGRASSDRWHVRKDGSRFFANGVMMPLYVGENLSGYAKIAIDLTEKQRRADELQRAHDELDLRVKERTRELAESNLALVQEMEVREIAERQKIDLLGRLVTGQEVERRRIARDIHDQLGQRLTALRLKIASLKEIAAGHEEIEARVERLQEIGERLDSEVSFLAWELRPTALDDLGLVDAVGTFVNEWSRHYEMAAEFHSAGLSKGRLNHDTETHLYRITQEALNNIIKHAQATNVTVMLEKRDENVILIIEDDGCGFDSSAIRGSGDSEMGLGLIGMSERAALTGGDLEVESSPGKGTTIFVRVPMVM